MNMTDKVMQQDERLHEIERQITMIWKTLQSMSAYQLSINIPSDAMFEIPEHKQV